MGNKVLWRVHLFVLWFVLVCFFNPMFQCHWNLSNDLNCKSEILISTDFHYVILPCKKHIRFLKSVILSRAVPKNWKRIDNFLVKLYMKSVAEMKRIYIQIDITTQWGTGFTNIINQKEIVALQKKNMFQHIQFLNHQELSQDKQIWWFSIKKIIIFEIIYIVWPTPYIHKGGLEVFKNGHNRKG